MMSLEGREGEGPNTLRGCLVRGSGERGRMILGGRSINEKEDGVDRLEVYLLTRK
jgi:hypothetical protein